MYNFEEIEKKWQKNWEETQIYKTKNDFSLPKIYTLIEFPYPSGVGLHVGHVKGQTAVDIYARFKRMNGNNVLNAMGWDAFGLPAENFAIKNKAHPDKFTKENIANFKKQIKSFGPSFDWDREIDTTDPKYYKWTQWIFLELFKAGLAYEKKAPINWCPSCKTGLANEEVINGKCERCDSEVEQKLMKQWFLAITKYGDKLEEDLSDLNWPEYIKTSQKNWIGKSEGGEFEMEKYGDNNKKISVFTTRIDTVFGMTYAVIAPDHPSVLDFVDEKQKKSCQDYIEKSAKKSSMERTELNKEKIGVFTGSYVVNPFNGKKVPLWIADYVLGNYGTGAVMAVPAHDERDFEFAKKYDLEIKQSITPYIICYGKSTPRSDNDIVKFNCSTVIIKNPKNNKYLVGSFKSGEYGFCGGKLEIGETNEDCIKREIVEETGYTDFEVKKVILDESFSRGYKERKNREELAKDKVFYAELLSEKSTGIDKEEKSKHQFLWLDKEEVGKTLTITHHKFFWDMYSDEKILTDDGILIDSGKFTGLKSKEAREKLINFVQKKGIGKRVSNYKLRDWLFSRQRYRGEPIPLIHLEEKKLNDLINFNFRQKDIFDKILNGTKTIETRALNPEEKDNYFGDVKVGDVVIFSNKTNNEKYLVKINNIYNFKNLKEFFKDKEKLNKTFGKDLNNITFEKLEELYSFSPDYINKINTNGLIGFEFDIISKIYNSIDSKIIIDEKLPLLLPDVKNYEPSGTGESPLANVSEFVNIKLANNLTGKRETNTMPQWAGSSWYFLRYIDPKNELEFASKENLKYFMPVDIYFGGAEHTTVHLLYSRFWNKALHDLGIVPVSEPYKRRVQHGLIMGEDGRKMSKRWGNVINPDDVIKKYGADTMRAYIMFMGPYGDSVPWSTSAIAGVNRFVNKIYNLQEKIINKDNNENIRLLHKTIKKFGEDIENISYHTAISAGMIFVNNTTKTGITKDNFKKFLQIMAPFMPFITEEIWHNLGEKSSIHISSWPKYNDDLTKDDKVTIGIQVLGKLRGEIEILNEEDKNSVILKAKKVEGVRRWIEGKEIIKEIYVPGKIVNFVVK